MEVSNRYQINISFLPSKKLPNGSLCGPFAVVDFHSMVLQCVMFAKSCKSFVHFHEGMSSPTALRSLSFWRLLCGHPCPWFSSHPEWPDPHRPLAVSRIRMLLQHHLHDCAKPRSSDTVCSFTLQSIYALQSVRMGSAPVSREGHSGEQKGQWGGHHFYSEWCHDGSC